MSGMAASHAGSPANVEHRSTMRIFLWIGGRAMAQRGLHSLFPLDELAINGFSAIPARLPLILHAFARPRTR